MRYSSNLIMKFFPTDSFYFKLFLNWSIKIKCRPLSAKGDWWWGSTSIFLDNSTNIGIIKIDKIRKILLRIRKNPKNVRFKDLCKICDYYFGPPSQCGGSHRIYKTPWPKDPRINIQSKKGISKVYQVKQVLKAIDKLENEDDKSRW